MIEINGFPAEEIVMKLDGELSKNGLVDPEILAHSLAGWSNILRLHAAAHYRGWATDSTKIHGLEIQLRASTPRRGSYEIVIYLIAAGVIGGASWDATKTLLNGLPKLFHGFIDAKREQDEIKFAAERIRIAAEYSSPPAEDIEKEMRFVKHIDKSAKNIALSIGRNATQCSLILPNNQILTVDSENKRWINQPIPTAPIVEEPGLIDRREIQLISINRKNGWGRFDFANPRDNIENRQQECKVMNSLASSPYNIYTQSLNEQSTIRVWLQLINRPDSETGSWFYRIYGTEEPGDMVFN